MPCTLEDALNELLSPDLAARDLVLDHTFKAVEAQTDPYPLQIDSDVRRAFEQRGIGRLYRHQSQALSHLASGKNVVVATPTASGKSLCFHLPVLQSLKEDPATRALFIFPTKALGQDQVSSLLETTENAGLSLKVHTFDGDTPSHVRATVRKEANVVVTNPDMLHQGILPHHTTWMSFLRNLRYVVLDELHTYRGVFGSHVANVIRRLERLCAFYGSSPQYICGSATIANPGELAEQLTNQPFEVIKESGAPTGPKRLLVTRPPIVNRALGIRQSYILYARKMLHPFLRAKIPTIVFGLSRLNVEVLLKYLQDDLKDLRMDPELVQGYRGGYLPQTRRKIEHGLRDGSVRFVVSTNALELGIDIGSLKACFVVGYPGSIASLWQQAGRAGRREELSTTIYIPRSNPLDQFIANEPGFLLEANPEAARIDPDNLVILAEHMKCAAFELPFETTEPYGRMNEEETTDILDTLSAHRILHRAGKRYHWTQKIYPANQVSLRSIPGDNFVVIDQDIDTLIAEVDFKSAHTTLYMGAIYNLQGVQYEVLHLDYEGHKAFVRKVKPDYFTDAMTYVEVRPLEAESVHKTTGFQIESGDVKVTEKVVGYKKIRFHTNENVGYGEVTLPELTKHTSAAWVVIPGKILHKTALLAAQGVGQSERPVAPEDIALEVLSGLSHAMHQIASIHLMCDPHDIGRCVGDRTEQWFAPLSNTNQSTALRARNRGKAIDPFHFDPALFLYDTFPGGIGLCRSLAPTLPTLLAQVRDHILSCPCEGGCPSCLGAFAQPSPLLKQASSALLSELLYTSNEVNAA
jgi:DEAD/DEAH box helicase domain-containing protein